MKWLPSLNALSPDVRAGKCVTDEPNLPGTLRRAPPPCRDARSRVTLATAPRMTFFFYVPLSLSLHAPTRTHEPARRRYSVRTLMTREADAAKASASHASPFCCTTAALLPAGDNDGAEPAGATKQKPRPHHPFSRLHQHRVAAPAPHTYFPPTPRDTRRACCRRTQTKAYQLRTGPA
jgi:hypothetical protein